MERIISEEQLNLIKNNYSFYHALENQGPIYVNSYVKFELILYYLKLNKNILLNNSLEFKDIISFLENDDYLITEDCLITSNQSYSLDSFYSLLNRVRDLKQHSNQPIPFKSYSIKEPSIKIYNHSKTVSLPKNSYLHQPFLSERDNFAILLTDNKDCYNYPKEVKEEYKYRMEKLILSFLNDQLPPLEQPYNELTILISYLKIFPLKKSFKELPSIFCHIPINEIGLRKMNYEEEEIKQYQESIRETIIAKIRLQKKYDFSLRYNTMSHLYLEQLGQNIRRMKIREFQQRFEYYCQTHNSEIFNHNYLKNILISLESGYVDLNYSYYNPVVRLFHLDHQKAIFYTELHLETLLNLFDDESFINSLDAKKLLKEEPI